MGDDGVAAVGGYGKEEGVLVPKKRFASLAEMQGFVDALRGLLAPIACFVMTDPGKESDYWRPIGLVISRADTSTESHSVLYIEEPPVDDEHYLTVDRGTEHLGLVVWVTWPQQGHRLPDLEVDDVFFYVLALISFVMAPGDMLVRVGGMEKGVWEDGQVHAFLGDVAFRLASLVGPVTVLDSGSPAIRIVKRFGARTCVSICEWKDGDLVVSRYGQSVILPACSPSQAAAFMAGTVEWPSAR